MLMFGYIWIEEVSLWYCQATLTCLRWLRAGVCESRGYEQRVQAEARKAQVGVSDQLLD